MFLRMDNGPEFIAGTLRDSCKEQNLQTNLLRPGSTLAERSHRIIQLEPQRRTIDPRSVRFDVEIHFMLKEHRNNYNHYRPHSALSYLTPVEYTTKWRTENSLLDS